MSAMTQEAINLMNILPENDQSLVLELIRKLVLAWDPDFTKLTNSEKAELEESLSDDETIPYDAVNWD